MTCKSRISKLSPSEHVRKSRAMQLSLGKQYMDLATCTSSKSGLYGIYDRSGSDHENLNGDPICPEYEKCTYLALELSSRARVHGTQTVRAEAIYSITRERKCTQVKPHYSTDAAPLSIPSQKFLTLIPGIIY